MPREIKHFGILAINAHGAAVDMEIVERDGTFMLRSGLYQQILTLSADCTWQDIEDEVKRVSGVIRIVQLPA